MQVVIYTYQFMSEASDLTLAMPSPESSRLASVDIFLCTRGRGAANQGNTRRVNVGIQEGSSGIREATRSRINV